MRHRRILIRKSPWFDFFTASEREDYNVAAKAVGPAIQHAGQKLSGYASTTARATVGQNATPGLMREDVMPEPIARQIR